MVWGLRLVIGSLHGITDNYNGKTKENACSQTYYLLTVKTGKFVQNYPSILQFITPRLEGALRYLRKNNLKLMPPLMGTINPLNPEELLTYYMYICIYPPKQMYKSESFQNIPR